MSVAQTWVEINAGDHELLPGGKVAPKATSANEFVRLAEAAYYEIVADMRWEISSNHSNAPLEPSVDSVLVNCPPDGTPSLYAHYSASGDLLYIGKTHHPRKRQNGHRNTAHWWKQVSRIHFWEYQNELMLGRAESEAIRVNSPLYNIHGNAKPQS